MRLLTSAGKSYNVYWADTARTGFLFFEMHDERPLPAIAMEFDGLEWLKREDENEGDKMFDGFSVLDNIKRTAAGVVLLSLGKGE